jgi:hypothetical protein
VVAEQFHAERDEAWQQITSVADIHDIETTVRTLQPITQRAGASSRRVIAAS